MASRRSLHSQLSSIMETMARSALSQVCKLMEDDSAEVRLELSRLLLANSALAEKVNSLECELTIVRSDAPKFCTSSRSVGVQTTTCYTDEDPHDAGVPTIEGIFDKNWCTNLWKDKDPYSLERVTDSPQSTEKSLTTLSDRMTVAEVKEDDYVADAADRFQQEPLSTQAEHEDNFLKEPEQLSLDYSAGSSTCSLPFEQVVSADGIDESSLHLMPIIDTEEAFSSHIIPIEDDDDEDDDIQFVQESQTDNTENTAAHGDSEKPDVPNTRGSNKVRYTCQICSRMFFHKGTLTHHMKSHKSNFCNICRQHFPHRGKLNSHTCVPSVPSQRVAKECEVCGKTFANPSALRIHYVVHTGEKPYRCSLCGKGFTQKGNLKCHIRIHTGERPFLCVKCGKAFTQKVNLNHHLTAHRNREFMGQTRLARRHLKKFIAEPCQ